jgi:hypothetical protein
MTDSPTAMHAPHKAADAYIAAIRNAIARKTRLKISSIKPIPIINDAKLTTWLSGWQRSAADLPVHLQPLCSAIDWQINSIF